jgi:hypothetical protein
MKGGPPGQAALSVSSRTFLVHHVNRDINARAGRLVPTPVVALRSDDAPLIVDEGLPRVRQVMMPADLKRLHKYLVELERIEAISDERRAVVESEWPELAYKLPPKTEH